MSSAVYSAQYSLARASAAQHRRTGHIRSYGEIDDCSRAFAARLYRQRRVLVHAERIVMLPATLSTNAARIDSPSPVACSVEATASRPRPSLITDVD